MEKRNEMNRTNQYKVLALLSATWFAAEARQIQLPPVVVGMQDGYIHYKEPRPKDDEACWNYDLWANANATLADRGHTTKDNRKTESLTGIWFNQDSFTLLEAFAPGSYSPLYPALGVFRVTPKFNFSQQTANFGITIERGLCCGKYRVGLRATLPVRHVRVQQDDCCDLAETLDDVRVLVNEQAQTNRNFNPPDGLTIVKESYAYRLDFLASLPYEANNASILNRIVLFSDPNRLGRISMAAQDMTGSSMDEVDVTANSVAAGQPVHVILSDKIPNLPFSLVNAPETASANQVLPSESQLPILVGDGTSAFAVANDGSGNERARFDASQDYTALGNNPVQQRRLWVVPTTRNAPTNATPPTNAATPTTFIKDESAQTLETDVEQIVRNGIRSVEDFLTASGLTFDSQQMSGLGDLDAALYFSRQGCWWYAEVWGGMLCPTGRKIKNPGQLLLLQSTGNNKHWEGRVGLTFGMEPTDWFNFTLGGYYSHAFKHKENVAASFQGATVKNIGPATTANISWGYFVGNADFTFRVPCNPFVGFTFGYSPYVKQKDKVKFTETTLPDLFGVTQTLDASVIEKRTNVVSHSFRAEGFMQTCYGEVFAGFSRVFAGKNSMHESTYYLGMVAYF